MSAARTLKWTYCAPAAYLIIASLHWTPALGQAVGSKSSAAATEATDDCPNIPPLNQMSSTPQGVTKSPTAAIEIAAKERDAAGAAYWDAAKGLDERNGRPEQPPPLSLKAYQDAATADEKGAKQFELAGTNWKEAADKYKAAAAGIKGFGDATGLKKTTAALQKNAKRSNQCAIRVYNAAAVEREKAAMSTKDAAQADEMDKAAKNRESAAHVGKPAKDDKGSKDDGGDGGDDGEDK